MPSFAALFRLFLTPAGLPVLAALDTSVIFFFPFGIDLAVALMSARTRPLAWLYPLLATAGSTIGASVTFWLGRKIGEHGVERFVPGTRLERIKARIGGRAAISSGLLALVPPPFPFTAFILAAGALDLDFRRFLAGFGAARLARYAVVSALAVRYGPSIVRWMDSDAFDIVAGAAVLVAIAGSAVSAWRAIVGSGLKRPA